MRMILVLNDVESISLQRDESTGSCSLSSTIERDSGSSWDVAVHAYESIVLALFAQGVAFQPEVVKALQASYEAIGNHFA